MQHLAQQLLSREPLHFSAPALLYQPYCPGDSPFKFATIKLCYSIFFFGVISGPVKERFPDLDREWFSKINLSIPLPVEVEFDLYVGARGRTFGFYNSSAPYQSTPVRLEM